MSLGKIQSYNLEVPSSQRVSYNNNYQQGTQQLQEKQKSKQFLGALEMQGALSTKLDFQDQSRSVENQIKGGNFMLGDISSLNQTESSIVTIQSNQEKYPIFNNPFMKGSHLNTSVNKSGLQVQNVVQREGYTFGVQFNEERKTQDMFRILEQQQQERQVQDLKRFQDEQKVKEFYQVRNLENIDEEKSGAPSSYFQSEIRQFRQANQGSLTNNFSINQDQCQKFYDELNEMKEKVFTHLSGQQKKFKEKGLSQKEKLEIKRDIEEKVEQIKARYEEMKEKYWEYFTDFNTFESNKKKQQNVEMMRQLIEEFVQKFDKKVKNESGKKFAFSQTNSLSKDKISLKEINQQLNKETSQSSSTQSKENNLDKGFLIQEENKTNQIKEEESFKEYLKQNLNNSKKQEENSENYFKKKINNSAYKKLSETTIIQEQKFQNINKSALNDFVEIFTGTENKFLEEDFQKEQEKDSRFQIQFQEQARFSARSKDSEQKNEKNVLINQEKLYFPTFGSPQKNQDSLEIAKNFYLMTQSQTNFKEFYDCPVCFERINEKILSQHIDFCLQKKNTKRNNQEEEGKNNFSQNNLFKNSYQKYENNENFKKYEKNEIYENFQNFQNNENNENFKKNLIYENQSELFGANQLIEQLYKKNEQEYKMNFEQSQKKLGIMGGQKSQYNDETFYSSEEPQVVLDRLQKKVATILHNLYKILDQEKMPLTRQILSETIQELQAQITCQDISVTQKALQKLEKNIILLQQDKSTSYGIYLYLKGVIKILQEKDTFLEKQQVLHEISCLYQNPFNYENDNNYYFKKNNFQKTRNNTHFLNSNYSAYKPSYQRFDFQTVQNQTLNLNPQNYSNSSDFQMDTCEIILQNNQKLILHQEILSKKMKFNNIAKNLKNRLPQGHKGNFVLISDIYQQVLNQNIPENQWELFIQQKLGI